MNIGGRTEAHVLSALVDEGLQVSIPWGDHCRYDMVVEAGGLLWRAQVKTSRKLDGTLYFEASSRGWDGKQKSIRRPYRDDEVDIFITWCPEASSFVYVVNKDDLNTGIHLRLDPCLDGRSHGIRWAKDYTLSTWLSHLSTEQVDRVRFSAPRSSRSRSSK